MTISSIEKEFDELFTNPATTNMRAIDLNGEPYPMASCKAIKSFYRQKINELVDDFKSMFPENRFTQWNDFNNEWECILSKTDLKNIVNKLKEKYGTSIK